MLVCHDIKLLFAHVPKTGGSAVTAALLPYLSKKLVLAIGRRGWQPHLHQFGNMHSAWLRTKDSVLPLIAQQGYRYAAVHRSPWERVSSLFQIQAKGRTIDEYLKDAFGNEPGMLRWWINPAIKIAGPHVTNWLDYETLADDFAKLMRNCGVDDPPGLPQTNVTENKQPAWKVLTPTAIEIIREKFVDDIEKFGYFAPKEPS